MIKEGVAPERSHYPTIYRPRNNDGRLHGRISHALCLTRSVNKCSYRTLWGERIDRQRRAIARALIDKYGFPWGNYCCRGGAPTRRRFIRRFVADESVPLGTWEASPWQVTTMLERGFRGSVPTLARMILSWNGRPHAQGDGVLDHTSGRSGPLSRALQEAVRANCTPCGGRGLRVRPGGEDWHDRWWARCVVRRLHSDRGAGETGGSPPAYHLCGLGGV